MRRLGSNKAEVGIWVGKSLAKGAGTTKVEDQLPLLAVLEVGT